MKRRARRGPALIALASLVAALAALVLFRLRDEARESALSAAEANPARTEPPSENDARGSAGSSPRPGPTEARVPDAVDTSRATPAATEFRVDVLGPTGRPFLGAPAIVFLAIEEGDRTRLNALAEHFESQTAFDLQAAWEQEEPPRSGTADGGFVAPARSASMLVADRNGAGLAQVELAPPIPSLVRVQLAAEHHVIVRVLDADLNPLPELWCNLEFRAASAEPASGRSLSSARSDAEGVAVFGLPSGALERLRSDAVIEVTTYFPPNRHPATQVPRDALDGERGIDFVLPAFGSVELRTRSVPGGPETLYLQIQELRAGVDPDELASSIYIVRAGESAVFDHVPVGIEFLALAKAMDGKDAQRQPLRLTGPTRPGERVVATVP